MRLSCKKIVGIVTVLTGAFLGGLSGSESVWATGSEGDNCYRLSWSIVTTSKTNYQSGRNQMEAGGGSGTEGQSNATKHESNRVCYDASNQKIYAEEVTNGEPMALAVQGDDLCLLTSKDDGGYEPAKCINDWKSSSGFDSDKLKNLGLMAGIDGVKIGEGVSGGVRGKDFSEAAELSLSSEELARLRAVTEVKNVIEEQTKKEQEARDEEEEKKEADEGEKTCASSGAGGALGWILCPILENVSEAVNDIYDEYVKPSLEVKAELFSGGDDGTRAAWEMFRNIANVAFIILLLVVIFSQLTGYGIDNYGIKKILPKLIIGVLLMNMSYLICVLCVDLSNILGGGLKDMFDGMAVDIGQTKIVGADGNSVAYAGSAGRSFLSLGLLGLLGAGGTAAVIFNPAILLSLLVAAIGIGISIFFLFLLLSARQAAVVVLTVISPLAFAAFMLPNTKKYYDKWLKFMQVMLFVYPIAGLLVGGGNFVSRLLVSAGTDNGSMSFMTALTAMLIGVVPILFIPSVIKGSFAAFGSAGRALSGFGKQASGRATKFAKERDAYKNAQQAGLMRKTRIKAGYIGKDSDGNYVRRPRLGALISGGRRGQQRNALAFRKMLSDQGSLEATAGEDFLLNTQVANREEAIVANGENKDIGLLTNGLDRALRSNDKAAIYAYSNQLTKMGESGIEGVRRVYDGMFEQNGTTLRNGYSANAVKSLADHIVTDHAGTYKNSARSMFEVASSINRANIDRQGGFVGGSAMSTGHYVNSDDGRNRLMQKSKSATLSSMNDNEFDMTYRVPSTDDDGNVRRDNSGNIVYGDDYRLPVDDNERRVLGEQIYNALKNADSMDQNRVAHLRRMLHETGYSPETQTVEIVNGGNNNNGGHPYAVPPAPF